MFYPIPEQSLKPVQDARQLFVSYQDAKLEAQRNASKLVWEKRGVTEYLISVRNSHGQRVRKSLGPRNADTESIFSIRNEARELALAHWSHMQKAYARQVNINRALMLGVVPNPVVGVLQRLSDAGLSKKFRIIGTNAIYAYASAAAVTFSESITATADVDLLWDSRSKIAIASPNPKGMLGLFREFDPTFTKMTSQIYTLVNKDGYQIDLIKRDEGWENSEPGQIWPNGEDFWAVKVKNMDWLLSSPQFSSIVIASNGQMAQMQTVDPRAFVVFKFFVFEKPKRETIKSMRVRLQAETVLQLIEQWLPHLALNDVTVFPQSVRDTVAKLRGQ